MPSSQHRLHLQTSLRRRNQTIEEARRQIQAASRTLERIPAELFEKLAEMVDRAASGLAQGGKIILFGNGGSAADAQHIAGELVHRLNRPRRALPAMALTGNLSAITAIANDDSFSDIFARQLEAWAQPGDIVIGISTSGRSPNIHRGLRRARSLGAFTVAWTGQRGNLLRRSVHLLLSFPSRDTQRIQETYMVFAHIFCDLLEKRIMTSRRHR
jgi:D-sedoheptulose 7-phosphate isomerase